MDGTLGVHWVDGGARRRQRGAALADASVPRVRTTGAGRWAREAERAREGAVPSAARRAVSERRRRQEGVGV